MFTNDLNGVEDSRSKIMDIYQRILNEDLNSLKYIANYLGDWEEGTDKGRETLALIRELNNRIETTLRDNTYRLLNVDLENYLENQRTINSSNI